MLSSYNVIHVRISSFNFIQLSYFQFNSDFLTLHVTIVELIKIINIHQESCDFDQWLISYCNIKYEVINAFIWCLNFRSSCMKNHKEITKNRSFQ